MILSLSNFVQTPRDYQDNILYDVECHYREQHGTKPGVHRRRMYTSPTGTGKGSVELWLLQWAKSMKLDAVIVTPNLEVIRGFLERLGVNLEGLSKAKMHKLAQSVGIWTPIRLRNKINLGERTTPQIICYDEAHHAIESNSVSGDLFAACPYSIFLGLTATGYRGTPTGTRLLREAWGEPIEVMTWPEAVRDGWVAMPEVEIVPLVDDDQVTITGGDFQSKAASTAYESRLEALADLVCSYWQSNYGVCLPDGFEWPTMVSVPSTEIAHLLCRAVQDRGVGASTILQDTKQAERTRAYAACLDCSEVLIQITVVSEGVDLQLVHLIDARPTMSCVSWAQQTGRIVRPQTPAKYTCTNRNFERFAFLWAGCVPNAVIKAAQDAFETPSKRAAARHLGLESLGRFKSIPLPLLDGRTASMYMIYDADNGVKVEWCVIVAPGTAEALVARRVIESKLVKNKHAEDPETADKVPEYQYRSAKWVRVAKAPESIKGFKSTPQKGKLSANQAKWWDRKAATCGLHPHSVDITRRQFAALPVLADARMKMR